MSKSLNFIKSQFSQIKRGGFNVLLTKLYALFICIFALSIVLLIRLLRPFMVIHIRSLHSDRIGAFTSNIELYLCERDIGTYGKRVVSIFFYNIDVICNYQLKKMWERTLKVTRLFKIASMVYRLNSFIPGGDERLLPRSTDRDVKGLFAILPPHLSFTAGEDLQGKEALLRMGVPEGTPFVCFHSRDSAYLKSLIPSVNWDYHDYRDSDIQNYLPAASKLTSRGYFAIRIGAVVNKPLNVTDQKIIDYATKHRTDFMDIYLGANCYFFITSTTGIFGIPTIFRSPVLVVNSIPLNYVLSWYPYMLFIPKKLWLRKEKRFLTFKEIMNSEVGMFFTSEEYEKLQIGIIENTPEEIADAALEMDDRLQGRWQETQEDIELQHKFWSLYNNKNSKFHGKITTRIGSKFLRKNVNLLN